MNKLRNRSLFTSGEWEVVQYILDHSESVVSINIGELAEKTYSSNATIIRICRKLGCSGFREMKLKLSRELENSKFVDRTVNYSVPFSAGESVPVVLESMSALYRNGLNAVQGCMDPLILQQITDKILQADRLVLYGIGDSQITAKRFVNKLIKLGIFAIIATETNEQEHITSQLNSKDCAIFISYSGTKQELNLAVPTLKRKRVPIIALTAVSDSPLAKRSDLSIQIPRLEGDTDEKIATFYSQLAFSYILDVLYALIYNRF